MTAVVNTAQRLRGYVKEALKEPATETASDLVPIYGGGYGGDLEKWYREKLGRDHWQHRRDERKPDYLVMRKRTRLGGVLYVPSAEHATFLLNYHLDVSRGLQHVLSENRTKVFRFYVDMDLEHRDVPIDDNVLMRYIRCIGETARMFFPTDAIVEDLGHICVLRAPIKTKRVRRTSDESFASFDGIDSIDYEVHKTGVHLVWPKMMVTAKQALTMRGAIVARLCEFFSEAETRQNPWEDIIDEAVYINGGLRMVFSYKLEKTKCDGTNPSCTDPVCRQSAPTPGNYTHTFDAFTRPYTPWVYLGDNGTIDDQRTSYITTPPKDWGSLPIDWGSMRLYGLMTIRQFGRSIPTPQWVMYAGCPLAVASTDPKKQVEDPETGRRLFRDEYNATQSLVRREVISRTSPSRRIIEDFLRKDTVSRYAGVYVRKMYYVGKARARVVVQVGGTGSNFCHNKNGNHGSNHIYFEITKQAVVQRCYSTKGSEYSGGLCREYRSLPWKTSFSLAHALWPDEGEAMIQRINAAKVRDYNRAKRSNANLMASFVMAYNNCVLRQGVYSIRRDRVVGVPRTEQAQAPMEVQQSMFGDVEDAPETRPRKRKRTS